MTFNRPLPPVELFIRKLGWAVASSWTHSSPSCREHQGLGDLALIVSLASLHWCLSHKGWELHFRKQLFDLYLSPLSEERETSEAISVNIPFFFRHIFRHLPPLNFLGAEMYNFSLENCYLVSLYYLCFLSTEEDQPQTSKWANEENQDG